MPDGGGWRVIGRAAARPGRDRRSRGIGYVHSAIDHYSSIAYSEALDDEQGETAAGFWRRANGFFTALGIQVEAVLTDNGSCYRSRAFTAALAGVEHRFIKPYTPRTNGKAERFNRTLLDEWAYVRPYHSEAERIAALDDWLHLYNHHRGHSTRGGQATHHRVEQPAEALQLGRRLFGCGRGPVGVVARDPTEQCAPDRTAEHDGDGHDQHHGGDHEDDSDHVQ